MRLIMLLIALIVVGLLVTSNISKKDQPTLESPIGTTGSGAPKISVQPKDVQQFEKDMNAFMENEASEQAKKISQATQ
ncbi:hypothetical protein SAMN04488490_3646 [Marinobacter sp. LV10R510-11A]|nr:hypothetical protein SAMN04488490_3646 [Marinobacter sp. LV10R510-11A]